MSRVQVIAEVGENHIGNIEMAKQAISEAKKSGADVVKFQSYRACDLRSDIGQDVKDWIERVELSDEAHHELKRIADAEGIEFLSTPVNVNRAELLRQMGLTKVKIASADIVNQPLLRYVNEWAESVILSTGMATFEEIDAALNLLSKVRNVCILHCVSKYPLADDEANLKVIPTLKERFGIPVGYSDHTIGILAPVTAVALGAVIIEKHFTLDKSLEGTDHVLSVTPDELREMVNQIRRLEQMLGSGEKVLIPAEQENRMLMRHAFV